MRTRTALTRLGALTATGLVAGSLTLISTGTAQAATATPQVTAAEKWVAGMLGGTSSDHADLLPSSYGGANYGASADAIISLAEAGDTTDATRIATALKNGIDSYIAGDAYGDTGSTYSGSAAKAAVALAAAGIDPSSVTTAGGSNLVTRLEGTVQPSGRIQDTSQYGDYANVLGQAFAANALTQAGSTDASRATTFLLSQQCGGGWFRQSFTETKDASGNQVGTNTSCDADPKSSPSVDATATAVLNLLPQLDTSATAARAIGRAETWLVSVEDADGGWGDSSVGGASNANTTGLVVRALGQLGHTLAAEKGAEWLRGTQLRNVGACAPYAAGDLGAIAYDHSAWATAQKSHVSGSLDQFVVAASQALSALQYVPATGSAPKVTGPAGYARAGTAAAYTVSKLAPGASACVSDSTSKELVASGIAGTTSAKLTLPAGTANRTVAVVADDNNKASTITKVLAAKKLFPKLSATRVKVGGKETVTVSGLAAGEKVAIKLRSATVASGSASSTGVYKATFTVKGALGTAAVVATGQFADRTGTTNLTVVRAS